MSSIYSSDIVDLLYWHSQTQLPSQPGSLEQLDLGCISSLEVDIYTLIKIQQSNKGNKWGISSI